MNEQPTPKRKKASPEKLSSTEKGRIVERIVALMHTYPDTGIKVERNVRLSPVLNKTGTKREIDVLLTGDIAGHSVQIAIECKNEQRPIDTPAIDAFAKKLQRVGVPYGIYVSASGYTKDAIENATQDGIRTFTLKGLTEEVLHASIIEAFHSLVYLFCQVRVVYITTLSETYNLLQAPFYDVNGKQCGGLGDLIWQKWISERLLLPLGTHELPLELPAGWNFVIDSHVIPVLSMLAVVDVAGLFGSHTGQATGGFYSLERASNNVVDRNLFEVTLDVSSSDYVLMWVHSEDELQRLLERNEATQVHHRIKLPRIVAGGIYWPPSERVWKRMNERMRGFEAGELPDPRPFNFQEMEGLSIRTAFEPIWEGYINSRRRGDVGATTARDGSENDLI
jgi:Restriction endonuclease